MVYGPIAAYLVEAFPAKIRYTALSLPYHIGNGVFGGLLPLIGLDIVAATGNIYAGLYYPIAVAGDLRRRVPVARGHARRADLEGVRDRDARPRQNRYRGAGLRRTPSGNSDPAAAARAISLGKPLRRPEKRPCGGWSVMRKRTEIWIPGSGEPEPGTWSQSRCSHVGGERVHHRLSRLQRHENTVEVHRRAAEDFVAQRGRNRVQHRRSNRPRPEARQCRARQPASPDPEARPPPTPCASAHPGLWGVCCNGTVSRVPRRSAGRTPTSGRWHGEIPNIERPRIWPPRAAGWMTVPTSATARKSTMWYTPVSTSTSTSAKDATNDSEFPSCGYVSRATPIRPCPASAAADRLVNALISLGTSWPS